MTLSQLKHAFTGGHVLNYKTVILYRKNSANQSLVPIAQNDVETVMVPRAVGEDGVAVKHPGVVDDEANLTVANQCAGQQLDPDQATDGHQVLCVHSKQVHQGIVQVSQNPLCNCSHVTRVVQFKMTLGLPFENEATHRKMFIPNTTLKFT